MSDPAVVAAWIGGASAIVASLVTVVATKAHDYRFLQPMLADRRKALVGNWHGEAVQAELTATVELRLGASGKNVTGVAELQFVFGGTDRHLILDLTGGFLHDQFLKLDYTKKDDDGAIQFGTLVVELGADARTMVGRYVGYGSISDRIVSGEMSLKKRIS
jgi:hypothetical protein